MSVSINLDKISGRDFYERITAAMLLLKNNPGSELIIPPGEYILTTERARTAQKKVMSGEFGENPQKVMFSPSYVYDRGFDFDGHDGTAVIGNGVKIMIDGFMEPVSIRNCRNITVKGLTFDHVRKPYSKGTVEGVTEKDGVKALRCVFGSEYSLQEKTPLRLRTCIYDEGCGYFVCRAGELLSVDIDNNTLYYRADGRNERYIGAEVYNIHTYHSRPIILIENSENTVLENVTIHSAPGMGITAQHASDIMIKELKVVPSEGEHFSTNTDATHFASCRGLLRVEDSIFEGHGDDAVNVHTYYHILSDVKGRTATLFCPAPDGTHSQSIDYPEMGDAMHLVPKSTLSGEETFFVTDVKPEIDKHAVSVTFDRDLPKETDGMLMADYDATPRLEFVRNRVRNHFARSVLIKSREALVEDCELSRAFICGILVSAEAGWYEGVPSRNIVIRRNRISDCGREAPDACGGILVTMDTDDWSEAHDFVLIEDNYVNCPDTKGGIYVSCVKDAVVLNNDVISSDEEAAVTVE